MGGTGRRERWKRDSPGELEEEEIRRSCRMERGIGRRSTSRRELEIDGVRDEEQRMTGRRKGFKCLSDDRCERLGSKGEEEWEVTCEGEWMDRVAESVVAEPRGTCIYVCSVSGVGLMGSRVWASKIAWGVGA